MSYHAYMVMTAPGVSSLRVAREIDDALRTAIDRTFHRWGRKRSLPSLRWSVEHWDGHVTLVGTPPPRSPRKTRIVERWATALAMEPLAGPGSRWFTSTDGWHLEIHE